jgi:hypothetical protein
MPDFLFSMTIQYLEETSDYVLLLAQMEENLHT